MRWLVDTHALIWFADGSPRLSAKARTLIEDPAQELSFSLGSVWELAIKLSLGRLTLEVPLPEFLAKIQGVSSIEFLPIAPSHLYKVADLPRHHGDPFDRLLAAQCLVEDRGIISRDESFDAYGVRRVW